MPKAILLIFLLAAFTTKAFAIEPILDQQAMIYLNVSFDVDTKKRQHINMVSDSTGG